MMTKIALVRVMVKVLVSGDGGYGYASGNNDGYEILVLVLSFT